MELNQENNQVRLCGTMAAAPRYSHSAGGQDFYSFPLEVERLSGSFDTLNIVLRESQLAAVEAEVVAGASVPALLPQAQSDSIMAAAMHIDKTDIIFFILIPSFLYL